MHFTRGTSQLQLKITSYSYAVLEASFLFNCSITLEDLVTSLRTF
jgi:hypothetical protein